MAKYIDKEILCEAYTHLNIDIYDDKKALSELKAKLLPFFEERAKYLLGEDIEVEVTFESGSLKTKLTVLGSAGAILLGGLNAYGSFRASVVSLSADARSLAEAANLEVMFRTKAKYCDRVNIEKRKGVFGRVDELLSSLDKIKSSVNSDTVPTSNQSIKEANGVIDNFVAWDAKFNKLYAKLDNVETEKCLADGFIIEINKIPKDFGWKSIIDGDGIRGATIRSDINKLSQLEAINTRLEIVKSNILKDMKSRLLDPKK